MHGMDPRFMRERSGALIQEAAEARLAAVSKGGGGWWGYLLRWELQRVLGLLAKRIRG
ncbi:hypothetical protein RxyAA322_18070 [Rubrobacter xylanophilus]|uniref:Uncharacterized protein n=1 Tax=Rubrobacter xylanophilus TaxID=49319 RepID=A0A510HMX4_9ACTN|nr:hypothetical protein [Rubrobacter xylanophilus]BBL79953.1 hypothetical protein RxyAA322_18070 [Rubrobacter xylanophilus]